MRAAILATAAAVAGTAFADGVHRRHAHEVLHNNRRAVQAGGDAGAETSPASVAQAPESEQTCGCHTEVITYYGEPTLIPLTTSTPSVEAVTTLSSTTTSTLTVVVTSQPPTTAPPAPVETPSEAPPAPAPSQESSTPVEAVSPVESETPAETPAPAPETPAPAPAPETTPAPAPETTPAPAPELPTNPITSFSSTGVYTIPAKTLTVTDSTTVCDATGTEVPSGTHTVGGVTTVVETATTVTCPYATVKPTGSTTTSVIETTTYVCPSAGTYTIAPITTYVPTSTMLVYPTPATYTPGTYTQPEQTMTVTNTNYHYVCPASSTTPAPAPTTPATTTSAAPSISIGASVSVDVPAPSSTGENNPSNVLGMTYSPYANDGQCKGEADVLKDVGDIAKKGFSHVRIYATDCNGLENVGKAAKQHNLKMIVGIYIDGSGVSAAQEQVQALSKWAQWDLVTLVVVGNEAIQNGFVTVGELAGLITSAKKSFQQSGYNGDVTTSESINIWEEQGKSLCSAIDSVGANIHPFFNAQTTADQAGKFARSEVKILESICPGKDVMILETGWPNGGQSNGAAVPGKEQQAAAIKALVEEVGKQSVFFSFSNDLWKDAGEFNVERYWGCIENF